jgi:hypothetical protein
MGYFTKYNKAKLWVLAAIIASIPVSAIALTYLNGSSGIDRNEEIIECVRGEGCKVIAHITRPPLSNAQVIKNNILSGPIFRINNDLHNINNPEERARRELLGQLLVLNAGDTQ